MTKIQFLAELEKALCDMPQKERSNAVEFYAEMIDERTEAGMSEDEATTELGTPYAVAYKMKMNMSIPALIKSKCKPKKPIRAWEIVLIILGLPIWLPLAIVALSVVLSVYVVIWSLVVSLWAVNVALVGTAVGCTAVFALELSSNYLCAMVYLGTGMLCAGAAVMMFFGCRFITKSVAKLSLKIVKLIKTLMIGKKKGEQK